MVHCWIFFSKCNDSNRASVILSTYFILKHPDPSGFSLINKPSPIFANQSTLTKTFGVQAFKYITRNMDKSRIIYKQIHVKNDALATTMINID